MNLELGFLTRSRVRLVRQTEIAECGLASLTMVANYHGLDIDLGAMRRRYEPSLRGAALKTLIGLSDRIGLTPRAVKLPLEELANLYVPAVLHWDMNHYVVLERVKGGKALIHNPDGRSTWMPMAEVSDHFTGVALELRPSNDFQAGKERERLRLSQLWQRMTGIKRALLQVLVLTLVLQAFVLASPYYMQLAIDQALPALDNDLLTVLAIGFGLFTLINAAATLLRSFVLMVAGTTIGFSLASNIARRLFRLPIEWFERRHVGDILSRFQSIGPIQNLLTQGAVAALVDGIMAVLTLMLMFWYSAQLAAVALVAFAFYAVVRAISYSFEREAIEASIITGGKEQSTLIETLRGMTTLRLFGRETLRHALWQTKLTDAVNADVRVARIGIWQGTANTLIFGIENILAIWLAIGFVIEGVGFSIGMVFAYMAYKSQFIQKAAALIDQAIAFKMLSLHLERLSDIALSEEDRGFGPSVERGDRQTTLGRLAENIALVDDRVDMDQVVAAAAAASIHADIMAMPMQYETLVGDMGSTLSGGQKQRVLLARALYRQPKILIMDEGTAHLDVQHEQAVNAAIAAMGITRIIIAHRQETIAQAERVVVMLGGQLHNLQDLLAAQEEIASNEPGDEGTIRA